MTRPARPRARRKPAPADRDELLRHSESLQRSLLENLPDTTVFLLDAQYRILVAQGDAIRRLSWLDETLFKGRSVEDLGEDVPTDNYKTETRFAASESIRGMGFLRAAVRPNDSIYSSLSYLKRFPLDGLKIDRSFLEGLETDPRAAAIVEAVIHMSRVLTVNVSPKGSSRSPSWHACASSAATVRRATTSRGRFPPTR